MTSDPVAYTTEQSELGEGARWDDRRDELLRVDLLAGRIYRDMINDDGALIPVRSYQVPRTVGAITPVHNDEGWMLAAEQGFTYLRPDGTLRPIAEVAPEDTRMNDAACDPQGRFWAGTVADDQRLRGGALYRLDHDGETELIMSGLTVSNGLGWSPDGRTMYLADSGPGVVYAFRFDAEPGTISANHVLIDVPKEVGSPDGLTVDAAGDLWVAIYGGVGSSATRPTESFARSSSSPPNRPPAALSRGPGCTGSMSPPQPSTGPTNSDVPTPALDSSTRSRPMRPVAPRNRSVLIRHGGPPSSMM
jgi:sugar lactone lactonase YvrE